MLTSRWELGSAGTQNATVGFGGQEFGELSSTEEYSYDSNLLGGYGLRLIE